MHGKLFSVTAQLETAEGTFEGTATAANLVAVKDGSYTTDYDKINRNLALPSLTEAAPLAGPSRIQLEFSMEMLGPSSLTADPAFDLLLRACGWRAYGSTDTTKVPWALGGAGANDVGRVVYFTASDTWTAGTVLEHGTLIEGGTTSAAQFKVLGSYVPGDTRIFALVTSGTDISGYTDTSIVDQATGTAIDITTTAGATLANRVYTPIDRASYFLHGSSGALGTLTPGTVLTGSVSKANGYILPVDGLPFGHPHDTDKGTALVERSHSFGFFTGSEDAVRGGISNIIDISQTPVQYDIPSLSLEFYEDGEQHRVSGCRGNVVMTYRAGRAPELKFTMQGSLVTTKTSPAPFPTIDLEADIAPRLVASTINIDNELKPLFSEFTIDGGSQIVVPPDHSSNSGVGVARYTGRRFSGNIDPEAVHTQEYGLHNHARVAIPFALTADWGTGGTDGFFAHVPRAIFSQVQRNNDNGILRYGMPMTLHGKAAAKGDEIILATY